MTSVQNMRNYSVLLHNDQGKIEYSAGFMYKIYCKKRDSICYVKVEDLYELAVKCSDYYEFQHNSLYSDLFVVPYAGQSSININHYLIIEVLRHFWDSYKALIG